MSELDPSSGEIESQASSVAEDSCELSQLPAIGEKRRCGIEWHRSAHWARMARRCSMASAGCSLVTTRIGRARAHRHRGAPLAASCDRSETYECHLRDGLAYVITEPVISSDLVDECNEFIKLRYREIVPSSGEIASQASGAKDDLTRRRIRMSYHNRPQSTRSDDVA